MLLIWGGFSVLFPPGRISQITNFLACLLLPHPPAGKFICRHEMIAIHNLTIHSLHPILMVSLHLSLLLLYLRCTFSLLLLSSYWIISHSRNDWWHPSFSCFEGNFTYRLENTHEKVDFIYQTYVDLINIYVECGSEIFLCVLFRLPQDTRTWTIM